MLTICDTHVLIFWQDDPIRLSIKAKTALEKGLQAKSLACLDISFWEIAMLMHSGRLRDDISSTQYMNDLRLVLSLTVLPITPEIATLSQQDFFNHNDPADRLIAATAIHHKAPLISADKKLKNIELLTVIW
ncbi:MAG: type II toxin-antitoxin system VapC family toxin [Deltaproteobacteria bacterium]|nr:type II toxin-antitoxin system VapC family toxin [Candidatus Tharpella aukensis]